MNLYIGNLTLETTEDDLRNLFSEFGEILSIKILREPETGMSRGFGFVDMADKFHGFDAIDNIDGTYLLGNIISVREAKQNNQAGGGRGGDRRSGGGDRRSGGNRRPPSSGNSFGSGY